MDAKISHLSNRKFVKSKVCQTFIFKYRYSAILNDKLTKFGN